MWKGTFERLASSVHFPKVATDLNSRENNTENEAEILRFADIF